MLKSRDLAVGVHDRGNAEIDDAAERAHEIDDGVCLAAQGLGRDIRHQCDRRRPVCTHRHEQQPENDDEGHGLEAARRGGIAVVYDGQNVHQDDCSARAEKHIGHTLADPGARFVRERAEKRQQEQREDVVRRHYHARIGLVELEGICKEQWNDAVVHLPESADGQERKSRQYGSFVVKFHMTPPILVSE